MGFSLQTFLENASTSQILMAVLILLSSVVIFYMLFKILKYVFMIGIICTALFTFDVINKEKIVQFDEKYQISKQLKDYFEKYSPKPEIKMSVKQIRNSVNF